MLKACIPNLKAAYDHENEINSDETPKSPGMKYRHYSPKAQMHIIKGSKLRTAEIINKIAQKRTASSEHRTGILASDETVSLYTKTPDNNPPENNITSIVISIGSRQKPETLAQGLYEALRRFDDFGVDVILSEAFDISGIGEAVMNRMIRAAAGRVIDTVFKVLFVCTGNTCRSPMAQYLLTDMLKESGRIDSFSVSSAGTRTVDGLTAAVNAVLVLRESGIDMSGHRASQINQKIISEADLVLTMTKLHKADILRLFPEFSKKIYTLGEISGNPDEEISDPYGGDKQEYLRCVSQLKILLKQAVNKIIELEAMKFDIV
jgi:protein-tyrosine phosphatase